MLFPSLLAMLFMLAMDLYKEVGSAAAMIIWEHSRRLLSDGQGLGSRHHQENMNTL